MCSKVLLNSFPMNGRTLGYVLPIKSKVRKLYLHYPRFHSGSQGLKSQIYIVLVLVALIFSHFIVFQNFRCSASMSNSSQNSERDALVTHLMAGEKADATHTAVKRLSMRRTSNCRSSLSFFQFFLGKWRPSVFKRLAILEPESFVNCESLHLFVKMFN